MRLIDRRLFAGIIHRACFWTALLLCAGYAGTQAAFYVSPTGSDSASGTIGSPFRTIEKARDAVSAINSGMTGDIYVYLRGGVYYLTSTLVFKRKDSGTNGFRVIYKGYTGEIPVISGGKKPSTGWTQYKGNIYQAGLDYDKKLRSLYVNGNICRMAEGQFIQGQGGAGTFTIAGTEPWAFTSGSCAAGIKFNTADFGAYTNAGDLELTSQQSTWTRQIICVDSVSTSGGFRIVTIQQPGFALVQTLCCNCARGGNDKWKVVNAFELLNAAGQFYFNKKTKILYYYKSANDDMNTAEVIAPVVEKLVDISGDSTSTRVKNITFDGINFSHNNYLLLNGGAYGSTNVQSVALTCKYRSDGNWHASLYNTNRPMDAAIELKNAEKIYFLNNIFTNLTGVGLSLLNDAVGCRIVGNIFNGISSAGINIGHCQHYKIGDGEIFGNGAEGACNNDTIRNNLLRNVCYEHIQAPGISAFFVAGTDLSHNDLSLTPYSSISFGWWWGNAGIPASTVMKNNKIDSNKVANGVSVLTDGGLIYVLGYSPNSEVRGNYLLNSRWNGIHPDDGCSYWNFAGNVFETAGNKWIELWSSNSYYDTVRDNFTNSSSAALNGTNSTIANNTTQLNAPPWTSATAKSIIAHAGLEPAYLSLLDGKTVGAVHGGAKSENDLPITRLSYCSIFDNGLCTLRPDLLIEIYDLHGRLVRQGSVKAIRAESRQRRYSQGAYIYRVMSRTGRNY